MTFRLVLNASSSCHTASLGPISFTGCKLTAIHRLGHENIPGAKTAVLLLQLVRPGVVRAKRFPYAKALQTLDAAS